jgi:uncharacterized membrane protein YciS (DUF1049 family)
MASIGLPGTSGFVGEFLVIIGSFQVSFWLALLGGMGMILGAAYMLYLYRRVIFGRLTKQDLRNILDLSPREWAVFAPLIVLTLWMGVYPTSFSSFFDASVAAMVKQHTAALAVPGSVAAADAAAVPVVPPLSPVSWPGLTRLPTPAPACADGRVGPGHDGGAGGHDGSGDGVCAGSARL